MRKTSSMSACRQGRCRRHLRLGRAALISRARAAGIYHFPAHGIPRRLNAQLPLQIASSSACEQAVSRELLLPLTRDTVLAAGALAEGFAEGAALALTIQRASKPITTDSVEPIMAAMDHDS